MLALWVFWTPLKITKQANNEINIEQILGIILAPNGRLLAPK